MFTLEFIEGEGPKLERAALAPEPTAPTQSEVNRD
jgi:hypothetical protein